MSSFITIGYILTKPMEFQESDNNNKNNKNNVVALGVQKSKRPTITTR